MAKATFMLYTDVHRRFQSVPKIVLHNKYY